MDTGELREDIWGNIKLWCLQPNVLNLYKNIKEYLRYLVHYLGKLLKSTLIVCFNQSQQKTNEIYHLSFQSPSNTNSEYLQLHIQPYQEQRLILSRVAIYDISGKSERMQQLSCTVKNNNEVIAAEVTINQNRIHGVQLTQTSDIHPGSGGIVTACGAMYQLF